jgi:hypothetical protein
MLLIILSWEQTDHITSDNTSTLYQLSNPDKVVPAIKFTLYHAKEWGDGGIVTYMLKLTTMWVQWSVLHTRYFNFLDLTERALEYPLDMRLHGLHSQAGCSDKEKSLCTCQVSNLSSTPQGVTLLTKLYWFLQRTKYFFNPAFYWHVTGSKIWNKMFSSPDFIVDSIELFLQHHG